MTSCFLPEGRLLRTEGNRTACADAGGLEQAMARGTVLEGTALLCDENHDLRVQVGPFTGRIPREETALGMGDGSTREIAVLARVGKPVAFTVLGLEGHGGEIVPLLSRRQAQEKAQAYILDHWAPGDIIPATVTHLEPFGAFVDIGCGLPSMIGVDRLSVSRIAHPADRLAPGQEIMAAILTVDRVGKRVVLTHRELLGTWAENAALFRPGMTVPGYVRGIKDYGIFVELTPNLSGLAEPGQEVREGDRVSVFLKAILPEKRKVKLHIIDTLPPPAQPDPPRYFVAGGRLERWEYAPAGRGRTGSVTVFQA